MINKKGMVIMDKLNKVDDFSSEQEDIKTYPHLAPRERQVSDMIAGGKKTSAIAAELGISPRTVKGYKQKICNKTAKADRESWVTIQENRK